MKNTKKRRVVKTGLLGLILMGMAANAYAFLGFGNSASWKEEVQLHDGSKIVVTRSQSRGGRHEIGQPLPITDHSVTFSLSGSGKTITWKDEYSEDVGGANFNVLALHILNNTPYIVTSPTACQEYNKWGRPNPPYVFFKYDGTAWHRINLAEFPAEFKEINLVINSYVHEKKLLDLRLVSAEMVKKFNSSLKQPEYKTIIRKTFETGKNSASNVDCPEEIHTENGHWLGIDWFSKEPNYESCLNVCERRSVHPKKCPCDRLFKGDK